MISLVCAIAFIISFNITYIAASEPGATPSDAICERVDVPISKALNDTNFDIAYNNVNTINYVIYSDTYWNVWGKKGPYANGGYKPIGYSEHVNNGVVLSTYHYTRTFLGSASHPRGDSGRKWGTYTVKAIGTTCIEDVWTVYTHRVYYGTTSD